MPDIARLSVRMDCKGVNFNTPIDRMPPGQFPYLFNVRVVEEGRLDGRPGYTKIIDLPDAPNSIRRLNDPSLRYAGSGYVYVGGVGSELYLGPVGAYNSVASGFSGSPLSLVPARPEQSPVAWMYVFDSLKQVKVRPDGIVYEVGIVPPSIAPVIEYGPPATANVQDGQTLGLWTVSGTVSAPSLQDRTNFSAPSIASILYASGNTGWCCINPILTQTFWVGERMMIVLNDGGANAETAVVREVHNAISASTVQAIAYDVGATGLCSLVITSSPTGLDRNSLITINSEVVRVLEIINAPSGTTYSIRCSTTGTHAVGDPINGLVSWFVYTLNTHVAGESLTANNVLFSHLTGVGAAFRGAGTNAAITSNGRPIDPANDYLHISLFLQNPQFVKTIRLMLCLDSTAVADFANPGNAYTWTITQAQLNTQGSSGDSWCEVLLPISAAVRSGSDLTRTLATVTAVGLEMDTAALGACSFGFDWWYLFGTYGQVIQPNSPTGVQYAYRFRDSSTGAKSVPGPLSRYSLFPLRESVIITPRPSTQVGVDTEDIYRLGGTLPTPLYVASLPNNTVTPQSFIDGLSDLQVQALGQSPDLQALQPWPLLVAPLSGIVDVIGTSVIWRSGDKFPLKMLDATVIVINGTAYQTYGPPTSDETLQLTADAGYIGGGTYVIASPTVAGQPLPYVFGPLEGPFAPTLFGLGDPLNGGNLYTTNPSDPDSASDANFLEESTPSSPLISGQVHKGLVFVGTKDDVLVTRYSYLTQIGASTSNQFQWTRVDAPSGFWCRWGTCDTPIGVAFIGRDGIYICNENEGLSISDDALYPLFPHDGQTAKPVNSGSNIIYPVDMSQAEHLRLSYCDEAIRFSYIDTNGTYCTLIYEIYRKRWLLNNYAHQIGYHYMVEGDVVAPKTQDILMLAIGNHSIMLAGGDTDDAFDIHSIVLLPSNDGGDERVQKLYVDTMTMLGGTGNVDMAASFDKAQTFSPVVTYVCTGVIQQFLENIASLADLSTHLDIGAKFSWTGGPSGPQLYAWEMSGFVQPYLCKRMVTQFIPFSFPGWKHLRRMYPALISNNDVLFYVWCQDGRKFGPYTIPSTGGRYRILPQMLDQNIKDLAFALELDGGDSEFSPFLQDFTCEVKEWTEETYIDLAIFRA